MALFVIRPFSYFYKLSLCQEQQTLWLTVAIFFISDVTNYWLIIDVWFVYYVFLSFSLLFTELIVVQLLVPYLLARFQLTGRECAE